MMTVGASAYDFSALNKYDIELFYTINENGTSVSVVKGPELYSSPQIVIPGTVTNDGVTYMVTSIGAEAFMNSGVTDIDMSDNIESIQGNAFYNSSLSTVVNLSKGLKSIGRSAFENSKISSIELHEGLESIGYRAFCNTPLSSIEIPSSVTLIDEWAFYNCRKLEFVKLGTNIKNIKSCTFLDCASLKTVELPEGLETIEERAFSCPNGQGLTSISFPSTLQKIGREAFTSCSFETVVLPNSVKTVGYRAFFGCKRLKEMTFSSGITEIPDGCLSSCESLIKVTIPEGITKIGTNAFYECKTLSSISLPESVVEVGASVLYGTALSSFVFPSKLKYIGIGMFSRCKNIATFTVPETIQEIRDNAFNACENMTAITLPESLTSIGTGAFFYCQSLEKISIPSGITRIEESCFYQCRALKTVELPANLLSIGRYAFNECTSLYQIVIPKKLESIDNYAFQSCSSLEEVTLPSTLSQLNDESFQYCSLLKKLHINRAIPPTGRGANSNGSWNNGIAGKDNVCVLYVPTGSKAEYEELKDTYYRNFQDIVEEDVDGTVYFQLRFKTDGNGSFKVNGTSIENQYVIEMKTDAEITIVPNSNYHLSSLLVDGINRTAEVVNNTYTIQNVKENYNIEATFELNPVVLTIKTGDGGQVGVSMKRNETYDCFINVEDGWQINTVLFNGSDVTSRLDGNLYTTPKLSNDAILIVTFEQNGESQARFAESNSNMKAYASTDGSLQITGVEAGEELQVVSSDGKLLTTIVSNGQAIRYQLPSHGVFVVHSNKKNIKLSY